MTAYAHTATDAQGKPISDTSKWQLLRQHLEKVAHLARDFARPLGMEAEAELAGLLHDLGKYAKRFQQRLRDPSIHGINHWAAGAKYACDLKAQAVAFAIEGHHTGLPAPHELKQMLHWWRDGQLLKEKTGCTETLDELGALYGADGLAIPMISPPEKKDFFAVALRIRFLFSCLVDADFLDTEQHFNPDQAQTRQEIDLQAPEALSLLRKHLEDLAQNSSGAPVSQLRQRLLADCLAAAEKDESLFTLTAPTGSGKTLASLAFALRHIETHNALLSANDPHRLRRIIVVIPYTSIIEQTARIYREIFAPSLGSDYVLEHHSSVSPSAQQEGAEQDAEDARLRRARLATENWAAPIVVTTSVQFFESLFDRKPSACRKLHNIARSVILFDEVQTLPSALVPSLLSAVKLLTQEPYGASAIFMTATQPAFATAEKALRPEGWRPTEISSNPQAMAETLRRTNILLPRQNEEISWPDLTTKIIQQPQALCVVNTTKDARELFKLVRDARGESAAHLTSRMCPAHRQKKLKLIRERLGHQQPIHLISTQLIEAGVDVDFPIAFRAFGPLDSIIQTAGRCNREGRHPEPCPVTVFRPVDGGMPRGAYKVATAKTEEFLNRNPHAKLHDPELYSEYFKELYGLVGPQASDDDPVFKASSQLDFPKAHEECCLVGENSRPVLVKWSRGEELIRKLECEHHLTADECREAQRYSVNLYEGEFQKALAQGHVYQPAEKWDFFVWNSHYDDDLGACSPEQFIL
jgi:CRISPR-associated helicase Cas3/CRISPR-associated endonuclease Cas3-HD